uniref:GATA-type domain-containing protein n=1 Tax=Mycena chlorophos TaxID=658473 RepID=A0ABQ0M4V9_MYCCL|nr:predicted protein [Mycena chlorophos]
MSSNQASAGTTGGGGGAAPTFNGKELHCTNCGGTQTPFYPGIITQGEVCHPCYRYELTKGVRRPPELEQRRVERVNGGGRR